MVREKRLERGLSQEELAELVGMSQGWVAKIESGEIKYPRRKTLERMAFALSVSFTELLIASGYATTRAEAERLAETPEPTSRPSIGERLDGVYDLLSTGERGSIEAIIKAKERELRKAAK